MAGEGNVMQFSMWTYPWDVQDLTADRVVGELEECGCTTISLAISYHAGHFLQPRSPYRKSYFPQDGTIYFEPRPALWADAPIQPLVARIVRDGNDVLADLIRRRDAGGLAVSCWTVCLHNTRLGLLHPGAVTRNAFNDPNIFNLCPSHPHVRHYVRTLVRDLSEQYRPDAIELESLGFMGFVHGFHHEKDGVGLTAEDDFLLSLCFCPACTARATAAGLDVERARITVRRWIIDACEREFPAPRWPEFPDLGIDVFRNHPEVYDFLLWRFEPVTSLVAETRSEAAPETKIHLIDLKDGWRGGCDIGATAQACDGAIVCGYDMTPTGIHALLAGARSRIGTKFLGTGFRLFYPEMSGAADVAARVMAAVQAGAERINFYNYGLIPAARLAWVRHAIEAAKT
ncbi:MAG TPA: hypothetical protein VGG47_14630 [Acidocella sp.]|jgi:hypothetical protein